MSDDKFEFKYSTAVHNPDGVLTEVHEALKVGPKLELNHNNKRYILQQSPISNTVKELENIVGISAIFSEPTWEPGIRNMFGCEFVKEYTKDIIRLTQLKIPCYLMVSKRLASYIRQNLPEETWCYPVEQTPHRVKTTLVVTRDKDFTLDGINSDLDVIRYINKKYKNKILCDPFCGYGEKIRKLAPDMNQYYFYDANSECINYIVNSLSESTKTVLDRDKLKNTSEDHRWQRDLLKENN